MSRTAAIVAPQNRDLGKLSKRLAGWLQARMAEAAEVRVVNLSYPLGAGMSHETILFDAEWHESDQRHSRGLVVRIKPSTAQVYQDGMFE